MKIFILIIFLTAVIRTFIAFVRSVDKNESNSKIFGLILVMVTTLIAYIHLCALFLKVK